MPLHHSRDGSVFRAETAGLTIDPGPKPITITRDELAQIGLQPLDDYRIPIDSGAPKEDVLGRTLSALDEAIRRCRAPEETWMAQDLKRTMILMSGLDEEVAQRILDQEGRPGTTILAP